MIRRNVFAIFFAVAMCAFALPVFAQSEGEFFGTLQQNLPESVNRPNVAAPQAGKAETVIVTSTAPVDASSSYGVYDAGQDRWSGYIAGAAAVFAALAVAFALGFVLTHRHNSSEEN